MAIMHQRLNNICLLMIACFCFSCQLQPGFEENISLGENGWPEKQPIVFNIPEIQETGVYQLESFIRQDNNYPFYNCYYLAEVKNSQNQLIKKGLIEAIFYDPKTGKPKGEGLGDMFNHHYTIFPAIPLKKGDKIKIQFRQFMRRDTLSGIISVGFALKPKAHAQN